MTRLPEGMPELPPKECLGVCDDEDTTGISGHGDEEIRAYGLACYRAGMERAAKVCNGRAVFLSGAPPYERGQGTELMRGEAELCAAAIRAAAIRAAEKS